MLAEQQPGSVCEGLRTLLNRTNSTTCTVLTHSNTMDCEGIECSTEGKLLTVTLMPCNKSVGLTVTHNSVELLSETIYSMPQPQQLVYDMDRQGLNISLEIVARNATEYYIMSLLSASLGLELPTTVIPLMCSGIHYQ